MYAIQVKNSDLPRFQPFIHLPEDKAEGIRTDDDAAINFARAVVAKYEADPNDPQRFFKLLKGNKFLIDLKNTDPAMKDITMDLLLHGEYEPHTTKLVESLVKPGDVCVDVGASIGYFTLLFAKLSGPTGQVFAFEPTQNQYPYLVENIKQSGYASHVQAFNLGAWSAGAEIKGKVNVGQTEKINVVALDSLLTNPIQRKVDFIKIDVDGAEPEVLRGLERTIQANPQLKMVIEYYPKYIKNLGLDPQAMLDFLDQYFTFEKIEGDYNEDYYNFFCTRK